MPSYIFEDESPSEHVQAVRNLQQQMLELHPRVVAEAIGATASQAAYAAQEYGGPEFETGLRIIMDHMIETLKALTEAYIDAQPVMRERVEAQIAATELADEANALGAMSVEDFTSRLHEAFDLS